MEPLLWGWHGVVHIFLVPMRLPLAWKTLFLNSHLICREEFHNTKCRLPLFYKLPCHCFLLVVAYGIGIWLSVEIICSVSWWICLFWSLVRVQWCQPMATLSIGWPHWMITRGTNMFSLWLGRFWSAHFLYCWQYCRSSGHPSILSTWFAHMFWKIKDNLNMCQCVKV